MTGRGLKHQSDSKKVNDNNRATNIRFIPCIRTCPHMKKDFLGASRKKWALVRSKPLTHSEPDLSTKSALECAAWAMHGSQVVVYSSHVVVPRVSYTLPST